MPLTLTTILVLDVVLERSKRSRPVVGVAVVLGLLIAAGTLTRSDALPLLGGATAITLARRRLWRALAATVAAAALPTFAVAVAVSVAADRPVFVATNTVSAIAGADCDQTLHGVDIGYWSFDCLVDVPLDHVSDETREKVAVEVTDPFGISPQLGPASEADLQNAQGRFVWTAVRERPLAIAGAVPFRIARGIGVWWGGHQPAHEFFEGRDLDWQCAGCWFHVAVILPGLAALVVGAALAVCTTRRGAPLDRRPRPPPAGGDGARPVDGVHRRHLRQHAAAGERRPAAGPARVDRRRRRHPSGRRRPGHAARGCVGERLIAEPPAPSRPSRPSR